MKILLYADDALGLNVAEIARGVSERTCLEVANGSSVFHIPNHPIRYPNTYSQLPEAIVKETRNADLSICFTSVPYENNYFYECEGKIAIVSFYAWDLLTSLPIENGAVFFLCTLLRSRLHLPAAHSKSTGCLNDYLWDKTGVDIGMRAGRFCQDCRSYLDKSVDKDSRSILPDLETLMHDLSVSSRANDSILTAWRAQGRTSISDDKTMFHVFLCHNSQDKPEVRKIAKLLQEKGIRTWFDEEQLRPGCAWQPELESAIGSIECAAVFVGKSGIGPWQDMEMRALLSEFARRKCPVIPTILPGAMDVPELPIFLRQLQWVDFRGDEEEAIRFLTWGITGNRQ